MINVVCLMLGNLIPTTHYPLPNTKCQTVPMESKKYWKGYEELQETPEFVQSKRSEFPKELPVLNELGSLATEKQGSRRDFLKLMGFSVSAAAIAASCEIPIKKAIPYVNKPEEITPGIANYYASSFVDGSDYCSVLVKTREGRPIKIEGNELSGLTQGGTSARAQASVVSLYDGARLPFPKKKGQKTDWATIDKEITQALGRANGDVVILSSSILSPSTRQVIADFQQKNRRAKHVVYEAISYAGILSAHDQSFGKKVVPGYDFSKADVMVSFGADFLGTWISPVEFTKQYIKNRQLNGAKMSKHWQFESNMSVTGSNADKRYSLKPSQEGLAVIALYNEIAKSSGQAAVSGGQLDATVAEGIKKAAIELLAAKGKSLVVSGSNNANVQVLVNAINDMLGNYGKTLDLDGAYNIGGDDKAFEDLVANMNAGKVGALIVYGVNPAYNYYNKAKFVSGLQKVGLTVSFNDREDETSEYITYLCPDSHYLESWNDVEPKKGFYSLVQPTIAPLFDTRQAQESLLTWAGNKTAYYDYLKQNWQSNVFAKQSKYTNFQAFWDAALHDGIFEESNPNKTGGTGVAAMYATGASTSTVLPKAVQQGLDTLGAGTAAAVSALTNQGGANRANANQAASAITGAAGKASGLELVVFENAMMGDGRYANNPFLQETPEPVSKVCWDNFAAVSEKYAKKQKWEEYDIVEVKAGEHTVKLPLVFQPGQLYGTVGVALGYGRTKSGSEAGNTGGNAFPFVQFNGQTFDYTVTSGVSVTKVGSAYALARTQTHHTLDDTHMGENRREIVNETTFGEYKKDKWAGNHAQQHVEEHKGTHFYTLYGKDPAYGTHKDALKQGHHWGLAVDLSSCIGCNACTVACHIENNVPIVGKNEVFRAHEMHWMRVDRYYSGDSENPEVTYMPMMCQHCDNAPCENVCPVAATNHSSEGLNQMAYNRCIGTRYCANNCPFKVRRFNWFDYQGADSFYKNTVWDNDQQTLATDLSRMVLNPDVTVRSRGVIEKCSFCVQRIQEGKLTAKKEGRPLKDGDIKTACQQSCPTHAITFGDMNDPESEVSKLKKSERNYELLEMIHVIPSVSYLTKVRNREPLQDAHGHSHTTKSEHS